MTVAITPTDVYPNSQYDPDSAPNQSYNCGPTSVTNILKYHQDKDYPINETRRLATTSNYKGTNLAERKVMLDRRGTASDIRRMSVSEVKAFLNGRRSMDLALLMSKIPLAIRVRPFAGSHSVTGISHGTGVCPVHKRAEPGIWVDNPDFYHTRGRHRYFYPDHAWVPAFEALGRWGVVPAKDKVIPTRVAHRKSCTATASLRARSGPGTNFSTVKILPSGFKFTSVLIEKAGGWYTVGTVRRRDWLSFVLNGRVVWVARGYVKEV